MSESPTVQALIIDDDAGVLFYHEMMVTDSSLNVDVITFDEAHDALNHIKEHHDSVEAFLIFLDLNMPTMDGWEFVKLLEKEGLIDQVHVIMITASLDENDRKRSEATPCVVQHIDKPISKAACDNLKNLDALSHLNL